MASKAPVNEIIREGGWEQSSSNGGEEKSSNLKLIFFKYLKVNAWESGIESDREGKDSRVILGTQLEARKRHLLRSEWQARAFWKKPWVLFDLAKSEVSGPQVV